jgi:hypothetical protein
MYLSIYAAKVKSFAREMAPSSRRRINVVTTNLTVRFRLCQNQRARMQIATDHDGGM